MKTADINDVTQEEFDDAVQTVISGIKASDKRLDTRLGTALRSLLVNPEARIEATTRKQIEYTRYSTSLKAMADAEDEGNYIDREDVDAVMSNFNIKTKSGKKAEGIVKVSVDDGTKTYNVPESSEFYTVDGLIFRAVSNVTASSAAGTLYEGAASYFFLVPVEAEETGTEYNIAQGTSLNTSVSLYSFIGSEAYKSFNGGSDVSGIRESISMIPSSLSIRGFVSKSACEGMLRDRFDDGRYPIIACSTVGYGNGAQRRDKHNAFGIGVGGRIDLYVRNFGDLYTISNIVTGRRRISYSGDEISSVSYDIDVLPSEFPGCYWVKNVSCVDEALSTGPDSDNRVNSPLEFTCVRTSHGISSTWHDFDVSKNPSEAFNTIWHGLALTANEVPPVVMTEDGYSVDEAWPEERLFSVSAYCLPQAIELQSYVDADNVRSVSTDVVVRCPIICTVEVSANVIYDVNNPIDVNDAAYRIRKYINGLGFVERLTRSEIVHILKECGAVSVDLDKKDMLYGTLYDALGREFKLSGDALVLNGLAEDAAMLSKDTAIFAVEPDSIQITLTPNK